MLLTCYFINQRQSVIIVDTKTVVQPKMTLDAHLLVALYILCSLASASAGNFYKIHINYIHCLRQVWCICSYDLRMCKNVYTKTGVKKIKLGVEICLSVSCDWLFCNFYLFNKIKSH